jgi:hypothetical protein
MTKILYLPTNEYLKFWIADGDYGIGFNTTVLEHAGSFNKPSFATIEDALTKICACYSTALFFVRVNKIKHLPILREELEIIYDE